MKVATRRNGNSACAGLRRWLLLSLLILGACSATRLAYDNADFFLLRWADRYIEPTAAQEEILEAGLKKALAKHRAELLPDYVLFLRGAAVVFGDGLTRSGGKCLIANFEDLYERTVTLALPLAAEILSDLDEQQSRQLERRLRKDDDRFRREWLQEDPRIRLERRSERFVERIEYWTGELYARQLELVTRATLAFPDTAPAWYAYRSEMQAELLRLVDARASSGEIKNHLRDWWMAQAGLDPQLSRDIDTATEGFVDMMVSLDGMLTSEQRERVLSRLGSFAEALEPALGPGERPLVAAVARPDICGTPGFDAKDLG